MWSGGAIVAGSPSSESVALRTSQPQFELGEA